MQWPRFTVLALITSVTCYIVWLQSSAWKSNVRIDVTNALTGNDEMYGGFGDDFLDGGAGSDLLYRRQGLPIVSAYIESTIKQINLRLKGSEKFWSQGGAEAVLQLWADYLSDRRPLDQFWTQHSETTTGQRSYR